MSDATSESQQPAVPPLTKEQIHAAEETARFLDPDLANAIMQGNKLVIQAVAAGAQTTQQVVDLMLRQGALPEMCPPGVRELLQERLKEIEAKREEEEAFQKRMWAGLAGTMAAMAGGEAMAAEGGTTGRSTTPLSPQVEQNYYENRLSADYWSGDFLKLMQSDPAQAGAIIEKEKSTNDTNTSAVKGESADLQTAIDKADAFRKENGQDETLKRYMAEIDAGRDPLGVECLRPDLEDKLIEYKRLKLAEDEARILCGGDECGNPQTNPALKKLHEQRELLDRLDKVNNTGTDAEKEAAAKAYATFVDQNKDFMAALDRNDVKGAMKIAAEQDKAAPEAAARADVASPEAGAAVKVATDDYRAAKVQTDGVQAKAELQQTLRPDDEYGSEAPKTATSAPSRVTIAIPPDKVGVDSTLLSQLGAPVNDAPPPAAPEEKPRPTAPSQGMGVSA